MATLRFKIRRDATEFFYTDEYTYRYYAEIFSRISLEHYLGPISELHAVCIDRGIIRLHAILRVPNRDAPHEIVEITSDYHFNVMDKMPEERVVYMVRTWLRDVTMHELEECIYVSGFRAFDPHRSEKRFSEK